MFEEVGGVGVGRDGGVAKFEIGMVAAGTLLWDTEAGGLEIEAGAGM